MSARTDLAGLIDASKPAGWKVHPQPINLPPLDDPAKPVAVVVEQRELATGQFAPDGATIPVQATLAIWVVVDGSRGDSPGDVEDRLELAAEQLVRILEPLPDHVWDGTATRSAYDPQKPAYLFEISAAGALTA